MLLAGKCRKPEEAIVIQETIEKVLKRKLDIEAIFRTGSLTTSNLFKQVSQLVVQSLFGIFLLVFF